MAASEVQAGVAEPLAGAEQAVTSANAAQEKALVIDDAQLIFMGRLWKEHRVTSTHGPKSKLRVDQLLVERGLAESRARAQALILAGLVFAGETKIAKAGQTLLLTRRLRVRGRDHPWVSRGGIKLAHAIDAFGLDPAGVIAMDIGSSTGGFTDVLLQKGAVHVFAVDSGRTNWPEAAAG